MIDGNGLRVQKCLPSCGGSNPNTVYIFSGSKVIAEYDNGASVASPSREYIYSGATLLAKIDSSGTKYYHQDHLSNRLVTDSNGNTVGQQGHFPFGEQWYPAPPASPPTKWEFTTYERDSESGNDYAQARYNMSRLARFSSPDPIAGSTSDPQSLNRYSYVRNMPVMFTDPSGMLMNCNTVKNSTDDQSASSDSDGSGMLPNEEMDPAAPQSGCPGAHTPPSGGGGDVFDPGAGLGFGGPSGDGGVGGIGPFGFTPGDGGGFGPGPVNDLLMDPLGNGDPCVFADLDGSGVASGFCGGGGDPGGGTDRAKALIMKILRADNDCSKFFNGAQEIQIFANSPAAAVLPTTAADFFASDHILPTTSLEPTQGAASDEGAGYGAVIAYNANPNSVFNSAFIPQTTRPYPQSQLGGFNGGSVQGQALMLLHELAHTLLLIPPDSSDAVKMGFPTSQTNTQTIANNCAHDIQSASKGH